MITINAILAVVLLFTIIAVMFDLKKERIIPNYLSFFLIIFGLGANAIISVLESSIWPLAYSIIGASLLFAFGATLYYTGVWAGGDTKLLTGFGATLATVDSIVAWPFLFTIVFNILILGSIIGLLWSIGLAIKHRKIFLEEIRKLIKKFKWIVALLYASLVLVILTFVFQKFTFAATSVWAAAVLIFYLTLSLKAVENACMYKTVSALELIEGDWIAEPIKHKNKIIYKPSKVGIEQKEIDKLVSLKVKSIHVKDGLPYLPAFLVALIVSLFGIDVMFLIFKSLV
jgi:Flp pilus assembly protein protease CpaA